MSDANADTTPETGPQDKEASTTARPWRPGRLRLPGMQSFSGAYLFGALFLLFALWIPGTFLTWITVQGVASDQAVTALVALAVMVPLTTGTYDLSVGGMLGFALVLLTWLTTKTHLPTGVLAVIVIAACGLLGVVTAILVVWVGVNSFIATLAMSSVLSALALLVTNGGQEILSRAGTTFNNLGNSQPLGVPLSFIYVLVIAAVLWYVFEHTPLGRHCYAAGGNPAAARLSGVRTGRLVFGSLVVSAMIAAFAGVVLTAKLGITDVTLGPAQLLPGFAAAFLGATQIKNGRVNVWGTVLAVYVLATGIKGFQLAGANVWVNDMFYGVALAVAVALATRRGLRTAVRR
jgi:ribose transport system permease protein